MNDSTRILLIEDNPGDVRLLREMLTEVAGAVLDLECADRLSSGLECLAAGDIDVILLDLSLPDSQGFETFLRAQAQAPRVPLIVLSGLDDEALALKAVREGAQDYLVKGHFDGLSLLRAIRYAVERKRAEEEIRQRTAQLEALRQVSLELTTELDLNRLLHSIVTRAVELLGGSAGGLYLYRPERDVLEWAVALGFKTVPVGTCLQRGEGLSGRVLETGGPLIVDDYQHWEGRAAIYEGIAITAVIGVPIRCRQEFLGVLTVIADPPRTFSQADVELLSLFAAHAAIAVRNARLFQAEQQQRAVAEALQAAAASISGTLDLDRVLDHILEQVARVVPGDAFNVMLVEDTTARIARWRGYDRPGGTDQMIATRFPIDRFANLQKMAQTGEAIVVRDTAADPEWVLLEGQEWLRSYVAAPIRVGGLTVGFLNVNGVRPGQFAPADAQRLQAFADHAAIAIQNAWLYREIRNYAEQLEHRVQERTAQLQAQYARLEAILRSASDGIVVADAQGEIIQTNPVFQTWLTRTLSPEDAERLREAVRDLARRAVERSKRTVELTGLDLQLSAAPITEQGIEQTAAVIAIHDVSHMKALDRMKSRFVSNVSHELRTPITTIKLYASLLQKAPPEKWQEYLNALTQEADRQARLIEDILEVSRIDTGRLELKPRPSSLNQLTQIAVAGLQALAEQRGLTLECRPADAHPLVLADPDRIVQVLINLITNAIHYTPEGGHVLVSTGRERAAGHDWAIVTVRDTGIGIPEDELPHVFERFFRGERPCAMQIPGTGLGLAIAKEIVELHGGRITVESQVDVGSTFTVWLPLAE